MSTRPLNTRIGPIELECDYPVIPRCRNGKTSSIFSEPCRRTAGQLRGVVGSATAGQPNGNGASTSTTSRSSTATRRRPQNSSRATTRPFMPAFLLTWSAMEQPCPRVLSEGVYGVIDDFW